MKQLKIRSLIVLAGLIIPAVGLAQDAPELNGANTAWVLVSTALVLFMTLPGLALFYSGLVRSKNVLSVLMQCFTIACLMSILWLVLAYGLAFGDGGGMNQFVGLGKFFPRRGRLGQPDRRYSRVRIFHVPDDVRHYHARPDRGWLR